MRYLHCFVIIIFFLISCSKIHVKGNPIRGMYSGYEQTAKYYPELLVHTDSSFQICILKYTNEPKVYVIRAQELKGCLDRYDDVIVYIWDAHCKSKECYSPSLLQKYCDEKSVELFVVAEYYSDDLTQFYQIERPIFGIDTKYYKTDYIDKYISKFEQELIGYKKGNGRMLYFKRGVYMGETTIKFEQ